MCPRYFWSPKVGELHRSSGLYSASIIWMRLVEVVVSHFPQSLMASTTESLLEVDGVVVQVTLVLQMLFNYQPGVR